MNEVSDDLRYKVVCACELVTIRSTMNCRWSEDLL